MLERRTSSADRVKADIWSKLTLDTNETEEFEPTIQAFIEVDKLAGKSPVAPLTTRYWPQWGFPSMRKEVEMVTRRAFW
jgi:hypothetical protein